MTERHSEFGGEKPYNQNSEQQNDYIKENEYNEEDEFQVHHSYVKHRMQKNKMERKVRQTQMWISRLRIIVRLIIIALMILFGYKLLKCHQWYLNKDIFNSLDNPRLEILNNKIVPSYKVLSALRRSDIPNVPIYRLDTTEMQTNIMQLDPIKNVYIRRFWFPARLQIIVEEQTPVLTISPAPNVSPIAFFTSEGKLIGRDYLPLNKSFNTVSVISYGTKGDDYRKWDKDKINIMRNIAKAVEEDSNEKVQYIDYRNPNDIYVKIQTVTLRIGVLDPNVFDRIKRISSILPQVKMLDKPIKYVDLRWKNANYIKLS